MDLYKDIAPLNGANDSSKNSVGDSAANKLFLATGFVKAEAFRLEQPSDPKKPTKEPKKRLLLEDYNKGFGNFEPRPYSAPAPASKSPLNKEFDRKLINQLEALRDGQNNQKKDSSGPVAQEAKPVVKTESEDLIEASKTAKKAALAYRAAQMLHHNWSKLDLDDNGYLSKEEITRASSKYDTLTDTRKELDYIKDNFETVSNLYMGELFGAKASISKKDVKFLGNLARATIQDNYYHRRANNYLKEHYQEIDTNGDGTLSCHELDHALDRTKTQSEEERLLDYVVNRRKGNYADPKSVGFDYNESKADLVHIDRADLDQTLDQRLARSREAIFVQNYYKMYSRIGKGAGLAVSCAAVAFGESLTGYTGFFAFVGRNALIGGGYLLGRKLGNYADRRASSNYFHKYQEKNLQRLLGDRQA